MEVSNTSLKNLNDQQRKTLIDSITDGSCILVLGPYTNLMDDGRSQRSILANYLANNMPTSVIIDDQERDSFGSIVGRILLDTKYNRTDILDQIKTFYRQQKSKILPNSPYDLILKLGFKTIFTTDFDSRLMKAFDDRNRNPLGLYFKINPQPDITAYIGSNDGLDDETPVIFNLFGIRDDPDSLAIGPEDELRQLYALTSQEVSAMITQKMGSRLSGCRWYLFVGFNFNSWGLATIFYFFNKLTKKTKDSRVFGLHSKPDVTLKDATVVYFKNLFPNEKNKNDILIDHQDAQVFFTELNALAEQVPPAAPSSAKQVFIICHPKDKELIDNFRNRLEAKFQEYDLSVQYNIRISPFDPQLTDEEMQQHVKTDDVVVFLISANWDDPRYDNFLALAIERDCTPTQVKGVLLNNYNIFDANRQKKTAFDIGAVKLFNNQKPMNLPTDLDQVVKEFDRFLEDAITTA